jgi:hypothetical protein
MPPALGPWALRLWALSPWPWPCPWALSKWALRLWTLASSPLRLARGALCR